MPYSEYSKWNLFKSDERKLWFYTNVYKHLIHNSIKKDMYISVQTNWMKEALIEKGISQIIDQREIVFQSQGNRWLDRKQDGHKRHEGGVRKDKNRCEEGSKLND